VLNFCVFATMAVSGFASGALVVAQGWRWLNLGSVPVVLGTGAALLWLAARRAQTQPAESAQ
jgi:hypothetical protein